MAFSLECNTIKKIGKQTFFINVSRKNWSVNFRNWRKLVNVSEQIKCLNIKSNWEMFYFLKIEF